MRAGAGARSEEADRLQTARIRGVENRDAIVEHVADVDMTAVHHDLHAVGAAALIAVGYVPDPAADAVRRNGGLRVEQPPARSGQPEHAVQELAASHGRQTTRESRRSRGFKFWLLAG